MKRLRLNVPVAGQRLHHRHRPRGPARSRHDRHPPGRNASSRRAATSHGDPTVGRPPGGRPPGESPHRAPGGRLRGEGDRPLLVHRRGPEARGTRPPRHGLPFPGRGRGQPRCRTAAVQGLRAARTGHVDRCLRFDRARHGAPAPGHGPRRPRRDPHKPGEGLEGFRGREAHPVPSRVLGPFCGPRRRRSPHRASFLQNAVGILKIRTRSRCIPSREARSPTPRSRRS